MTHWHTPLALALLIAGLAPLAQSSDWLSRTTLTVAPERLDCFGQKRSSGKGSLLLEHLRSLGRADGSLRFHAPLFSGYGVNLLDRNRTVASVGLSLVDG